MGHSLNGYKNQGGPCESQETGIPSGSPMQVAGAQAFGVIFLCFLQDISKGLHHKYYSQWGHRPTRDAGAAGGVLLHHATLLGPKQAFFMRGNIHFHRNQL